MKNIFLLFLGVLSFNSFAEEKKLKIDGVSRSYILRIPENRTDKAIIVLHGGAGNADISERMTNFTSIGNKNGYVVVYPNGTSRMALRNGSEKLLTWNANHCCGFAKDKQIDDVKFIDAIINDLKIDYGITKIYITGMSNGGMMTLRLGQKLNNKINAIAPVVGGMFVDDVLIKNNNVSTLMINGQQDQSVPYVGGFGAGRFANSWDKVELKPLNNLVQELVDTSKCQTIKEKENEIYKQKYAQCNNNVEIISYLLKNGGHAWYGGQRGSSLGDNPNIDNFDTTKMIVDFFNKH